MRIGLSCFVLGLWVLLGACSAKQEKSPALGQTTPRVGAEPDQIAQTKAPAELKEKSEQTGSFPKPYFSEIQILTESVEGEGCSSDVRRSESLIEEFSARINEEGKLVVGNQKPERFVLNVQLRAIGFDQSQYQFSVVDAAREEALPYGIQMRMRPGGSLELQFLDTTARIRLDRTPVYTFSAVEQRAGCTITHNVNLFSENAGKYALAQP